MKQPKQTTLHQEMKKGFDGWVRSLRSIQTTMKDTLSEDPRKESTAQEPDSAKQIKSGEKRWQDDGGESG